MTIKINYIKKISKINKVNSVFFCNGKFQTSSLKGFFNSKELKFVDEILKKK